MRRERAIAFLIASVPMMLIALAITRAILWPGILALILTPAIVLVILVPAVVIWIEAKLFLAAWDRWAPRLMKRRN